MAVTIVMPKLGQIMVEGIVNKWNKAPGDAVAEGDVIAEIETEKLNYDLEATGGGMFHPVVTEGTVVPVDGVLAYLLAEGESPPEPPQAAPSPAIEPAATPSTSVPRRSREATPPPGGVIPSTPGARRLASKLGVDLSKVTATGPRGRVVEDDVRKYADQSPAIPRGLPAPSRTVPVSGMRKAIAGHMRTSLSSTAQLSFLLEIDVTEAQRLRTRGLGGQCHHRIGPRARQGLRGGSRARPRHEHRPPRRRHPILRRGQYRPCGGAERRPHCACHQGRWLHEHIRDLPGVRSASRTPRERGTSPPTIRPEAPSRSACSAASTASRPY